MCSLRVMILTALLLIKTLQCLPFVLDWLKDISKAKIIPNIPTIVLKLQKKKCQMLPATTLGKRRNNYKATNEITVIKKARRNPSLLFAPIYNILCKQLYCINKTDIPIFYQFIVAML